MTALEARQSALGIQGTRWAQISLSIREAIQEAVKRGQLQCTVSIKKGFPEINNLRALGFKVRDIIDEVEISW